MFAPLALAMLALGPIQKPKAPVRPQVKKTAPTLGTVQLPGDNGKVASTYQLGAKGSELHFNLESAKLETIHPVPEALLVAGKKERLLTLGFWVQNPLNREQTLGPAEIRFTVVSPDDENFEFRGSYLHPTKGTSIYQSLKPAQKVRCTVTIPIYAEGPVTKLMVQRGNAPVLRYDLTGKLEKLDSIFTKDGIDLGDRANIDLDTFKKGVLFGPLTLAFVSGEAYTGKLQGVPPPQGERYWTMKVRFTNPMQKPVPIGFQYYYPELYTEDGEKISWSSSLLNASGENALYQDIAPGDEVVGLYHFRVPLSKRPAKLRLTHNGSGRTFEMPAAW